VNARRTENERVHTVIVVAAQYLLYGLALVAAGVWLVLDRAGKATLAVQAVLGLALVGVGILVAAHLHADPRPFVHDPDSTPFFAHAADNGFPSDHSAAAGLLAALVLRWRRPAGVLVAAGAVVVAWSRVAAHVHHAQDVVAGLLIGAAAGTLAVWLVARLIDAAGRRASAVAVTTADRAASRRHHERHRAA
jgi:membrane-associated phospholipid phosphatase